MKVLVVAISVIMFAAIVFGQDDPFATFDYPTPEPTPYQYPTPTPEPTPACDHTSSSADRFEVMRLLPPLRIRNFDLHNIEYTFEDRAGLHVGSLNADESTVMPANIWRQYKEKYWWILYCSKDGHIYTIVELTPDQIRAYKTKKEK